MKTLLMSVPVAVVVALLSSTAAGQAPVSPAPRINGPIGYVSAQRILNESTEGKAGIARYQALQQEKNAELRTKQQALEATRRQLAQPGTNPKRADLLQQEQQQRAELERATAQAQSELQMLQQQLQTDLQGLVRPVVAELAKTQNLQLVLNGDQAVVWSAPGLDMTSAVVERVNARTPATPSKP